MIENRVLLPEAEFKSNWKAYDVTNSNDKLGVILYIQVSPNWLSLILSLFFPSCVFGIKLLMINQSCFSPQALFFSPSWWYLWNEFVYALQTGTDLGQTVRIFYLRMGKVVFCYSWIRKSDTSKQKGGCFESVIEFFDFHYLVSLISW